MPARNSNLESHKDSTRSAIEVQLLKSLCRAGLQSISPDERNALSCHSWAAPDHRIVFEALVRLANIPPAALPHQLPAEATRMGFPDVAWDNYFQPLANRNECESSPTTTELIAALKTLTAPTKLPAPT